MNLRNLADRLQRLERKRPAGCGLWKLLYGEPVDANDLDPLTLQLLAEADALPSTAEEWDQADPIEAEIREAGGFLRPTAGGVARPRLPCGLRQLPADDLRPEEAADKTTDRSPVPPLQGENDDDR